MRNNANLNPYLVDLAKTLTLLPFGERSTFIAKSANSLRCSKQEVYRKLKSVGYTSNRKTRSDKGSTSVSDELALATAGLIVKSTRANKKQTMTIKGATETLFYNGYGNLNKETGEFTIPSPARISEVMKQKGCHPKQIANAKPYQALRSLHPNHVWQIDASLCVLVYLKNGKMGVMSNDLFNKNKPKNLKSIDDARIWRYVITDHYSGFIFLHYILGTENVIDTIDCLIEAMANTDPSCFMRGIPKIILSDKGSGNTASPMHNFCEKALGIKLLTHTRGNPRAKGQVETSQNIVETHFEGRLSFIGFNSKDELQSLAKRWQNTFNAKQIHSRHRKTRNEMYNTITEDQLLIPSSKEVLKELAVWTYPILKASAGLTLNLHTRAYGKQQYDLRNIPSVFIGEEFEVSMNAFKAPAINATRTLANGQKQSFVLEALAKDSAGFRLDAPIIGEEFKALAKTKTEQHLDSINKSAYNTNSFAEIEKAIAKRQKSYQNLDIMADLNYTDSFSKIGTTHKLEAPKLELPPLDLVSAAMELSRLSIHWQKDPSNNMLWLKSKYPDSVPQEQLENLVKELGSYYATN